jgi:exodeoxyribonuclease VIII
MKGTELSVSEKKMLTRAMSALFRYVNRFEHSSPREVTEEELGEYVASGFFSEHHLRWIGKKTIKFLEEYFAQAEIEVQHMTEKEYNEAEGVRRSDLWKMNDSPEKYKWFTEHPLEPTPTLVFGSACHKMILEPADFGDEYAVAPVCDRRTSDGKLMWKTFMEENEGKTIISADDAAVMKDMEEALEKCSLANDLIRGEGATEAPFFWTDGETGEKCKVKLDRLIKGLDGRLYVVDYKTAQCAETEAFNRSIMKFGYSLQAAMYTEAVMIGYHLPYRPGFIFVVQEKKAPYSINIVQVSPEVMEYGVKQFHTLLGRLHTCKELDEYPGYLPINGGYNWTELPAWVDMDEEEE